MKRHQYCYHITDGMSRSALSCGTVTADSMEDAAIEAARRANLEKLVETDSDGHESCRWVSPEGKRRSLYIYHDPQP